MNNRRKKIIEEAMKLFAHKGYHSTSVQEIVEQCDISKGSFYNYFKPKEELILSIFEYHYSIMFERVIQINLEDTLPPRDIFIKQITLQIEEFNRHQDFIRMLLREQTFNISEDLDNFAKRIRSETLKWHVSQLAEIYPQLPETHLYDCTAIFNGMLKEYFLLIVIDQRPIDITAVGSFLLNRMDSIVRGLLQEEPLLKREHLQDLLNFSKGKEELLLADIRHQIQVLQSQIDEKDTIFPLLETIEAEISKDVPQKIILEGLILLFEKVSIPTKRESESFVKLVQLLKLFIKQD